MHHAFVLHAADAECDLRKDLPDGGLPHALLLRLQTLDLLVELLALHVLHQKVNVRVVLEAVEQLEDGPPSLPLATVLRPVQVNMNLDLVLDADLQVLLAHFRLVDDLQSEELLRIACVSRSHLVDVGGGAAAKMAEHLIRRQLASILGQVVLRLKFSQREQDVLRKYFAGLI